MKFVSKIFQSPLTMIVFMWSYLSVGLFSLIFTDLNWVTVGIMFLFFAFGNGTVAHRYFAHESFKVSQPLRWFLGLWATLVGYTPLSYWIVSHRHHHRFSDTENDIHSPKTGILYSFIGWTLDYKAQQSTLTHRSTLVNLSRCQRDSVIKFMSTHFLVLNLTFLSILYIIDPILLFCGTVGYLIEQFRTGIINCCLHTRNFPGNYRNHDTSDNSQNNLMIGILSLGFGFHNNHHANQTKLILTERWFEIDLEGYLGWLLSKTNLKGSK